jgi:hypothetical protein
LELLCIPSNEVLFAHVLERLMVQEWVMQWVLERGWQSVSQSVLLLAQLSVPTWGHWMGQVSVMMLGLE